MEKYIMIVDDSKIIHKQITFFASEHFKDYKVLTAINGDEAIITIEKYLNQIEAIIIDFNMEGMTGLELIEKIKSENLLPISKIILCTANIQHAIKTKAQNLNITFKEKPLNSESFKEVVTKIIGN
jgi:CheY-like chemotaxis protein